MKILAKRLINFLLIIKKWKKEKEKERKETVTVSLENYAMPQTNNKKKCSN